MSSHKIVTFSSKTFEQFKKVIKKAKENKEEFITFEGDEYLVSYAHYLIEYLQPRFDKLKH